MNVSRYLKSNQIQLGMLNGHLDEVDPEQDREHELVRLKDEVIGELCALFSLSGEIRNETKFRKDFINREKRASTALEGGIAIPNLRSLQPRRTVIIFARTQDGVWFDAPDGEPSHVFFGLTAPEYEDREFQKFYKWITTAFTQEEWLRDALLWADDEHEVLKILGHLHT
ncbi:MAG: PTS sugar transporter subunit IIA [Planctomycetota bacterium]|jgi:mannitol/fructose-specific phosphotransferase system IIA component (Ntr-type)